MKQKDLKIAYETIADYVKPHGDSYVDAGNLFFAADVFKSAMESANAENARLTEVLKKIEAAGIVVCSAIAREALAKSPVP